MKKLGSQISKMIFQKMKFSAVKILRNNAFLVN